MRFRALLLGIILGLYPVGAMAGSGHDHGHSISYAPVDQTTAISNATKIVTELAKGNRLEKSWASTTASSAEKKVFNDKTEWVVVFVNDKITDAEKRMLHVFLNSGGEYIAANFTGE